MKTTSFLLLSLLAALTQTAHAQGAVAGAGECNPCGTTSSSTTPSQSSNNPNASKIRAILAIQHNQNNNQQILNSAGNALLNILTQSSADSNNSGRDTDADSDSSDDDTPTAAPPDNSNSAGNDQSQPPAIDYEQRARDAAAAVAVAAAVRLTANDTQDNADAAQAISQQVVAAQTAADDDASAINAVAQQLAKQDPVPTDVAPRDLEMFSAFTGSADDTASDTENGGWITHTSQRVKQQLADGLDQVISRGGNLLSSVTNDPVVRWVWEDQGTLSTAPAPSTTDSPEMAANKVIGQGALNSVGAAACYGGPMACAKALYSGGVKLVDQISADLGLAVTPTQSDTE